MTRDIDKIESVLDDERLNECPSVATFGKAGDLPSADTVLRVDGAHVVMHSRDDDAIAVVEYPPGACVRDTAFAGSLDDVHPILVRLAERTDATVLRDDFDE